MNFSKKVIFDVRFWLIASILLIAFIQIKFLILQSPTCSMDEVGYNDAAISLYQKGIFTSSTWSLNSNRFWAMNVPFYQFITFLWLRLFGFSALTIHMFHSFISLFNCILVYKLIRISNPNMTYKLVSLYVFLFFSCGPYIYLSLSARPDNLAISFFLLILILVKQVSPTFINSLSIVVLSSFLIATSIPSAIILFIYLLLTQRIRREIMFITTGFFLGAVTIYLLWNHHNVVQDFIQSAEYNRSESMKTSFWKSLILFFSEISILIFLFIYIVFSKWNSKREIINRIKILVILPVLVFLAAKLNPYYNSLFILILIIEIINNNKQLSKRISKNNIYKFSIILLLMLNSYQIFGRLFILHRNWDNRNYNKMQFTIARNITNGDVVYCEHSVYYEVKKRAKLLYTIQIFDLLSENEISKINVLVINPIRSKKRLKNRLDFNKWKMVARTSSDFNNANQFQEDNNVVIYRKRK